MTGANIPARHAEGQNLQEFLAAWASRAPARETVAAVVAALAEAAIAIAGVVAAAPLQRAGEERPSPVALADAAMVAALRRSPTAYYASAGEEAILTLRTDAGLAVAVDPLDPPDLATDITLGSLFSIFPPAAAGATASFLRPGSEQLAAGYVVYGPHTALVFTLGKGVFHFVLDPLSRTFVLLSDGVRIQPATREYAINAADYRHWPVPVRHFIDDCIAGGSGPRGKDFNMRWFGALVTEAHRIMMRGGVFLDPADERPSSEHRRLSLVFHANPIAMTTEQAGGTAIDGHRRILETPATDLLQPSALIFGSADKVARIVDYFNNTAAERAHSPLFGRRGLFRA